MPFESPETDVLASINNAMPKHAFLPWSEMLVISGNPIAVAASGTAYYLSYIWYQNPPTSADSLSWYPALAEGNYTLSIIGRTGGDRGACDIFLFDNFLGNIDYYQSSNSNNVRKTLEFSVYKAGQQKIDFFINKNPLSTNYGLTLSYVAVSPIF